MHHLPHVTALRHVHDFVLWLRFSDRTEGEVDLGSALEGEVFAPLRAPAFFAQVQLHPELRTATWPNGADFAPEFLYARV